VRFLLPTSHSANFAPHPFLGVFSACQVGSFFFFFQASANIAFLGSYGSHTFFSVKASVCLRLPFRRLFILPWIARVYSSGYPRLASFPPFFRSRFSSCFKFPAPLWQGCIAPDLKGYRSTCSPSGAPKRYAGFLPAASLR